MVESLEEMTQILNSLQPFAKQPALKCPTAKGTSFPQDWKNK